MVNRAPFYIILILCLVTVYTLFNIKERVMSIKMEIKEVSRQIQHESDMIHLFKAELSYLSSPERLKKLNSKYLLLEETKVSQMIGDPLNQKNNQKSLNIASNTKKTKSVKWIYRKGPSKYLTLVSGKQRR